MLFKNWDFEKWERKKYYTFIMEIFTIIPFVGLKNGTL